MAKLVRDKIAQIIAAKGQKPIGYFASKEEMKGLLAEKLVEETEEFRKDKNEEELADIQEVIDMIYEVYGFSKNRIDDLQTKKRTERGSFKRGYVLAAIH